MHMHNHGPHGHSMFGTDQNSAAVQLFGEIDRVRRTWESYQPAPPLRRSEMFVLGLMADLAANGQKSITMGQLARHMRQSMPGISQKVSVLEKQGYVLRVGDETDRRVVTIELTEKGEQVARQELQAFVGRMEQALQDLGPKKMEQLLDLMRQLSDRLEQTAVQPKAELTPRTGQTPSAPDGEPPPAGLPTARQRPRGRSPARNAGDDPTRKR